MATIGYLEGNRLIPLTDGQDGHGKIWALLSVSNCIDMVIAHYYNPNSTSLMHYFSLA